MGRVNQWAGQLFDGNVNSVTNHYATTTTEYIMWGRTTKQTFNRHMTNLEQETNELGRLEWIAVAVLCHQSGRDDVITPWGTNSVVDLICHIITPLQRLDVGRIYLILLSCASREVTLQEVTRQPHMAQVEIICYKRSITIEAVLDQSAEMLRTMVIDPERLRKRVTFLFVLIVTTVVVLHTAARI